MEASTIEASHVANGLGAAVDDRVPTATELSRRSARSELGEGRNMAVIALAQVEGIDVDWVQPGSLCAEHVELDGVADVDAARWLYVECIERQVGRFEDPVSRYRQGVNR